MNPNYEPAYTITNKLLNSIVRLETNRVGMEAVQLSYNVRARMADAAKASNLFHLAHILGLDVSIKDSEKLVEGRKLPIEDAGMRMLTNFRNVLEFNRSNATDGQLDLDVSIMLHLNKIVLTEWRESWDVRLRTSGEILDANIDNWTTARDPNIAPEAVELEIKQVLEWYNQSQGQVHDLIRIGILAFRLIEIMPYIAANRLTIIALVDYLLHRAGYISKSFLPVVRVFDVNQVEFLSLWNAVRLGRDLTVWLERFTQSLTKDMQETKGEVDKVLGEEEEKTTKQPFFDLNKRQLKVLRYLQTIPTVKREDYCQMMDVSTMTAFRDLNDLIRKKLLRLEGRGRGTKYKLANR